MSDLIMQLASVIQTDLNVLTATAQNIANVNTNGYKAMRSFPALLTPASRAVSARPTTAPVTSALVWVQQQQVVNEAGGGFKVTGNSTDLALSGNAWFVVQTPQGLRLTRDGGFHVDAGGQLVSAAGYAVQGSDGPVQLNAVPMDALRTDTGSDTGLSVSEDGVLSQGGREQTRLRVVTVNEGWRVVADGAGLYRYEGAVPDAVSGAAPEALSEAKAYTLRQGVLEQSNVDMGADMVRLMEASRHAESVQRALAAYDGLLGSGINQLGKD